MTYVLQSSQLEQSLKHACKKYEQQIDELKAEHVAYVTELQATHREAVASLDEQVRIISIPQKYAKYVFRCGFAELVHVTSTSIPPNPNGSINGTQTGQPCRVSPVTLLIAALILPV